MRSRRSVRTTSRSSKCAFRCITHSRLHHVLALVRPHIVPCRCVCPMRRTSCSLLPPQCTDAQSLVCKPTMIFGQSVRQNSGNTLFLDGLPRDAHVASLRSCRAAAAGRWATASPPRPPTMTAPATARMMLSASNQPLLPSLKRMHRRCYLGDIAAANVLATVTLRFQYERGTAWTDGQPQVHLSCCASRGYRSTMCMQIFVILQAVLS